MKALAVDFFFERKISLLDKKVVWLSLMNSLPSLKDCWKGSYMTLSYESLMISESNLDSWIFSAEVYAKTLYALECECKSMK